MAKEFLRFDELPCPLDQARPYCCIACGILVEVPDFAMAVQEWEGCTMSVTFIAACRECTREQVVAAYNRIVEESVVNHYPVVERHG